MKTRENNLTKNFVLFKGENDLNAVIKKTSILTNIYENGSKESEFKNLYKYS